MNWSNHSVKKLAKKTKNKTITKTKNSNNKTTPTLSSVVSFMNLTKRQLIIMNKFITPHSQNITNHINKL